jgi:ferredoxin
VQEEKVPVAQQGFIQLNAELAQLWPNIREVKAAPTDADKWNGIPDKLAYLET